MYRTVEMVLAGIVVVVFGLSAISRRLPDVGWLQVFRYDWPRLSEEQKAKHRRRANVISGLELIFIGVMLPLGYVAMTVMMFNNFSPITTTFVLAGSALCIVLGITAIVRSRR